MTGHLEVGVVVALVVTLLVAGLAGVATAAEPTSVTLTPSEPNASVGETTTYDVVVENADGGVGAYDLEISLSDPSVASIVAVDHRVTDSTMSKVVREGDSVRIQAALADTADAERITVATVVVETEAEGSSQVSLAVNALGDESGQSYAVERAADASLEVTGAPSPKPSGDAGSAADRDRSPASLVVFDTRLSDLRVGTGTPVSVTASVVSSGQQGANGPVTFSVDGEVVDRTTLSVDEYEVRRVTFTHAFDEPGTYELAVDGVSVGSVTVEAGAAGTDAGATETPGDETPDGVTPGRTAEPTAASPPTDSPVPERTTTVTGPGFGATAALAALGALAGALLGLRRRR